MCDNDLDCAKTLDRRWVIARKQHRCMACRETIVKGQRYHIDASLWEGSVANHRHCARCWEMIEALWKRGRESGEYGTIVDFDLNCGEIWRDPPDEVAALAFALPSDFTRSA